MPLPIADFVAAQLIRALPRRTIGRFVANLCDMRLGPRVSRALVTLYSRAYHIDMSQVMPRPNPYESFDSFFTRALVEGARPADSDAGDVVSPADGVLQAVGRVEPGCRIVVKKRTYELAKLIGNETETRGYEGGQFAVVYLSPRDYHRVHAPVDGPVVWVRSMPGDCYPVNRIGERWVPQLLIENRRVAIVQQHALFGPVTLVMVAAFAVGRISVCMRPQRDVPLGEHRFDPPAPTHRGQELGAFHLGSTVVVVAGPQARAWQRAPGQVRVGQSLTRAG